MLALGCPEFEYDHVPHATAVLTERCEALLVSLRSQVKDYLAVCVDTRPIHGGLFFGLTPVGHEYYAGAYRGSDEHCLKNYGVFMDGDPTVGTAPQFVKSELINLVAVLSGGWQAHKAAAVLPASHLSATDKLLYLISFVGKVFNEFLRIHPYANGNGHMGRYMVWAMLGGFGRWPRAWPLETRPPEPEYSESLRLYRQNQPERLEMFLINCLHG